MVQSVVLLGTADELSSYRALKVKVAAAYASLPLTVRTVEDVPGLGRMALQLGESSSSCLGNSASNVLRVVASLAPAAGLQASSHIGTAHVNSWMQFAVTDLEVPLAALGAKAKSVLVPALLILQRHLQHATFLVGNALTNADIALACVLHHAASVQAWDSSSTDESTSNVVRWYNTIVHQDCFITALQPSKSPSSPSPTATTEMVKGEQRLHGVAPPVVSKLYKRHRVRIKEVLAQGGANYLNQTITVGGWAKTTRNANKKAILFVELNDGSTGHGLQCVLNVESTTSGFEECQNSGGTGASFSFTGKCVESQGDEQAVELQVETATLLGAVMGGNLEGTAVGGAYYPIPKKNLTLEQLRLQAHLRARTKLHAAAMRVRHAMAYATHKFFHDHGFLYIHTPILTCADCEGAGEQFGVTTLMGADHTKPGVSLPTHQAPEAPAEGEVKKMSKKEQKRLAKKEQANKQKEESNKPTEEKIIGAVDYGKDFFGRRANLTVSGQLNVETHACALSDVYTFGPTFRAENSHTARHLSEFWMIEPEIAFSNLTDDINLAEDYLKYCVEYALAMCSDDLEFFEGNPFGEVGLRDRLRNVLDNPFKRLTYTEAIVVLQKAVEEDGIVFEEKPVWGIDLPSEHERYLCEKVYKMPVVLTDYPKEIKAFYMKLNPDGKTVAAADILVPKIGEIIGGSQREHDLETLKQRCIESGLDPKAVWWYLDLRKYGTVPHAGFGLGFERLILFITGLDNIRDVIPFPRWAGNAEF